MRVFESTACWVLTCNLTVHVSRLSCWLQGRLYRPILGQPPPLPEPLIAVSSTVNLGQIEQGKSYAALFELKNQSQDVLRISQVRASCSCTSHHLTNAEIQPGASTSLTLTYSSRGSRGNVSTQAEVFYFEKNTQQFGSMDCFVSGNVKPNIKVSTESIEFQAGVSSSHPLELSAEVIPYFAIQDAACANEAFSVVVLEATTQRARLLVSFDSTKWPLEVTESELTVKVDDPVVPLIRIPILVESAAEAKEPKI